MATVPVVPAPTTPVGSPVARLTLMIIAAIVWAVTQMPPMLPYVGASDESMQAIGVLWRVCAEAGFVALILFAHAWSGLAMAKLAADTWWRALLGLAVVVLGMLMPSRIDLSDGSALQASLYHVSVWLAPTVSGIGAAILGSCLAAGVLRRELARTAGVTFVGLAVVLAVVEAVAQAGVTVDNPLLPWWAGVSILLGTPLGIVGVVLLADWILGRPIPAGWLIAVGVVVLLPTLVLSGTNERAPSVALSALQTLAALLRWFGAVLLVGVWRYRHKPVKPEPIPDDSMALDEVTAEPLNDVAPETADNAPSEATRPA